MEKYGVKEYFEIIKHYWQDQFLPAQKVGALFLGAVALFGVYRTFSENKQKPVKPVLVNRKESQPTASFALKVAANIYVHVAGAVINPGVYHLSANKRVIDAINEAGGMQKDAFPDALNLAQKLKDGIKIYVPKKNEKGQSLDSNVQQVTRQTVASDNTGEQAKIMLNSAAIEDLDKLPGVGPTLAKRIIEYRQSHGSFKQISELNNVEGIGEKKFASLKDKVALE